MPTCRVCGDTLIGRLHACDRCETPHHDDCWDYNGGCAVYACRETISSVVNVSPTLDTLTRELAEQRATIEHDSNLSFRQYSCETLGGTALFSGATYTAGILGTLVSYPLGYLTLLSFGFLTGHLGNQFCIEASSAYLHYRQGFSFKQIVQGLKTEDFAHAIGAEPGYIPIDFSVCGYGALGSQKVAAGNTLCWGETTVKARICP